jgi:hypothetical protein
MVNNITAYIKFLMTAFRQVNNVKNNKNENSRRIMLIGFGALIYRFYGVQLFCFD